MFVASSAHKRPADPDRVCICKQEPIGCGMDYWKQTGASQASRHCLAAKTDACFRTARPSHHN